MNGVKIHAYLVSYYHVNKDGERVDEYPPCRSIILSVESNASKLLESISMRGTFNNILPSHEETRHWVNEHNSDRYAECIQRISRAVTGREDFYTKIELDGRFGVKML